MNMRILFAFLLSSVAALAFSQDSWKVCLDKKVLLNTSAEDQAGNVLKISAGNLNKNKNLVVSYKEASPQKGWERTMTAYNEKDQELKTQKGKKLTLKMSELKTLLQKNGSIRIYTISLPTDPKMKAQVRVRRVHLCSLALD